MVDPQLTPQPSAPWVFDTGPLSHFAKAGWLGLLKLIAGEHPVVVPDVVHAELLAGAAHHPHLSLVLAATSSWISVRPIEGDEALLSFAGFSTLLVGRDGSSNVGECGVLALARTLPALAVIDDGAARRIAAAHGIEHRGTAGLLLDAVRSHGLSRDAAGAVADDVLATEYRYPFAPGRFLAWAVENGLLPDE